MWGPWDWRSRWRLYAGAGAGLGALVVTLALVVPGGGGSDDRLVADESTPTPTATATATATAGPTGTSTPAPSPRATQGGSEAPTPGVSASSGSGDPVASSALMLRDAWVDAAFGHGRPLLSQRWGGGYDECQGKIVRSAEQLWAWPEETMLLEHLLTAGSESVAHEVFDSCTEPLMHPAHATDPVRTRRLDVGDEAVVIRTEQPLRVDTRAYARVGRTVVGVVWVQSGRVESDEPAQRALRAAVAALLGRSVPAPEAAPAPEPAAGTSGYLGVNDLRQYWHGDTAHEGPVRCGPEQGPEGHALRLAGPAVERSWFNGDGAPEHTWGFLRGRAPDAQAAVSDFASCRASQPQASPLPDVGDEAFCTSDNVAYGGLRCLARKGHTYYVFSGRTESDRSEVARWLRLAVARTPG